MMLARWNPLDEFSVVHREVDRLFGRSWGDVPARTNEGAWVPATEVTSGEGGWQLRVALPGVDKNDVNVAQICHSGFLTLSRTMNSMSQKSAMAGLSEPLRYQQRSKAIR